MIRSHGFRQAGETTEAWEDSRSRILASLPKPPSSSHDRSDLNHVARTHAAGIRYFITRDDNLRKKLGSAASTFNLKITSPGEFITDLWSAHDDTYAPVQLQNTSYTFESLAGVDINAVAPAFLVNGKNEKRKHLTKKIRDLSSDAANVDSKIVKTNEGDPIALMMRVIKKNSLDVPVLRLAGTHQSTVGRHVAHLQSSFARDAGLQVTHISDSHVSAQTARVLAAEGFREAAGQWWSVSVPVAKSKHKLAAILGSIKGVPEDVGLGEAISLLRKKDIPSTVVAVLEQQFWPMKIKNSSLPTYLVPIRPWYAIELFDSALSSNTLFRQMPLGIYREQVYYRSPRPSCGLKAPARLLWYVSKQPEVAGSGMIRACSYLLEVTVDRPRTLYKRHAQLGVYLLENVEDASSGGRTMALRFGMTETLPHPVSLPLVREIAAQYGYTNLPLRSPWQMPFNMFDEIYERGTHGAK